MRSFIAACFGPVILIIMTFLMNIPVYSQNNSSKKSVTLAYKYPSDRSVKYLNISKVVQTMDINGQQMDVNVSSALGCRVRSVGLQDKNLKLEITIDSMAQLIDSPQGSMGGNISAAAGKVFNIIISPRGKEIDLTDAKKTVFDVEGGGQVNAAQYFSDYFPDMPADELVAAGHTWTTNDTVISETSSMSMFVIVSAVNKFEGFEKINGFDCVKITSILTGSRNMVTQTQGMDVSTKGEFKGNSVLYFAPSEGFLIKQTVNTIQKGMIEVSSPENMSFPLVMDMTSVNEIQR